MSRHFRPWKIDQTQLLPAAFVDYVPADHLAQFVVALAREHLDLSEIVASYKSGLGQPPFDPRMMTALLLCAYCSGLYSSRRIAGRHEVSGDGHGRERNTPNLVADLNRLLGERVHEAPF